MALTREQLEALVASYGPVLRRVLLRLTYGRAADADDLLQRTFERAWLKRDTFHGGDPEPWIRGIARYEHLNHLRRRGQQIRLTQRAAAEPSLELGPADAPREDHRGPVADCIERLADIDQRIVNLFYGRDAAGGESPTREPITDREIGDHLTQALGEDWSLDRVRTRRHRALKQLRRCLSGKQVGGVQ